MDQPSVDDLVVDVRTLGEILAAIEGYRQQLDVFSQEALAQIDRLKHWIEQLPKDAEPEIVLHPLIQLKPELQ
jgi:hypothetical protein